MISFTQLLANCCVLRLWASRHDSIYDVISLCNLRVERGARRIKAYAPGFPRDDPPADPPNPTQFPTDVPAPEPHDVPAPEPVDPPPPDPGEKPAPPDRPQQDPKPRPIP